MSNEILNQFTKEYYGMLGSGVYANPTEVRGEDTALIIIDAQKCVAKEYFVETFKAIGADVEAIMPALDQLEANTNKTLSNIEKVLKTCRDVGIRPIHIKIQSLLPEAEDTGRLHTTAGMFYKPGSFATEFCEQAMPKEGELVLAKTCSGIHVGTQIDRVLRNLHIKKVIVIGFYTDQCVSTSVRDLSDLGYEVDIIEDAMNAMSEERHINALEGIQKIYANSETTEEFVKRMK